MAVVPCPIDVPPGHNAVIRRRWWVSSVAWLPGSQPVFLDAVAKLATGHPDLRARVIGSALFGEEDYAHGLR